MDKYYRILMYLNKTPFKSQRALAKGVDMSIGQVNALLKEMREQGYLDIKYLSEDKKQVEHVITRTGEQYLAEYLKESSLRRMSLKHSKESVKTAVILAAGSPAEFEVPVGLLLIQDTPVIELIINQVRQRGIEKIIVVTGEKSEQYERYFQNRDIIRIHNPRYKWTGTMESLACAKNEIDGNFLLIECNQIFEESAITALLEDEIDNGVILVNPSGSSDEAYVELNKNGSIFRISKDIRQLNSIDAELVGLCKISYPLFTKMLENFSNNRNPMLNYEYVIENIGRIYHINGVMVNDLAWSIIESEELYYKAANIIYPKIKKREQLRVENNAKATLLACMGWKEDEIQKFGISGGMTNTNFYVKHQEKEYILRMPGACTETIINRISEKHNDALAYSMGINPLTIYFNEHTGVKVTEFISQAETLSGKTARLEEMMKKTTNLLRTLHQSDMRMYGEFSVQMELERYKSMVEEKSGEYYEHYQEMDEFFYALLKRLEVLGIEKKACHNDLVAENFVVDGSGRLYLIDWEYSGYNDPMWDLASHLIECEFTPVEEELFLHHYFKEEPSCVQQEKIMIYKILQDILWSVWTISKELDGDDFGTYGPDRLKRARKMKEEYEKNYEKII